jgi:hypothetical protein
MPDTRDSVRPGRPVGPRDTAQHLGVPPDDVERIMTTFQDHLRRLEEQGQNPPSIDEVMAKFVEYLTDGHCAVGARKTAFDWLAQAVKRRSNPTE